MTNLPVVCYFNNPMLHELIKKRIEMQSLWLKKENTPVSQPGYSQNLV